MMRWFYIPVLLILSAHAFGQTDDAYRGLSGTTSALLESSADPNRFDNHGSLRSTAGKRYLEHEDGTPFFYFGDTAWEICWKSQKEDVTVYLDDRAAKGFTVIQLVAMSHQRLRNGGVTNRYGEPFFLEGALRLPNPRYFEYVDWLVGEINRRGMVAAIVPLWAYMAAVHIGSGPEWARPVTDEEALILARYLGARYAEDEVIWILGGDNTYKTQEQQDFWRQFAEAVDSSSDRKQLKTIHTAGHTTSFDFFEASTSWIDFHTYQSSHLANGEFTWKAGEKGYELSPVKPVLNSEAVYEDIYHRLWAPGDTTSAASFRIRDIHVRRALLESVCSGATAGMVYGANGIWQWHTDELPGSHDPRMGPLEAIHLPGSGQAGAIKMLLLNMGWPDMHPAQDLINWKDEDSYIPVATFSGNPLVYFPEEVSSISIHQAADAIGGYWINPVDGSTLVVQTDAAVDGSAVLVKPDGWADAIWIGRRPSQLSHDPERLNTVYAVRPNPSTRYRVLELELANHAFATLEIVDVLGRIVDRQELRLSAGKSQINLPAGDQGVHFYRLLLLTATGRKHEVSGRFLVVR